MIDMKTCCRVVCFLMIGVLSVVNGGCSVHSKPAAVPEVEDQGSGIPEKAPVSKGISESRVSQFDGLRDPAGKKITMPLVEKAERRDSSSYDSQKNFPTSMGPDTSGQRVLFDAGRPQSAQPQPKNQAGGDLLLNFDDADLAEVLRALADMLGLNYVLDPTVSGKVTIHSAVPMDAKQLYSVFLQILDINGLTAVQVGDIYQIGKSKDAGRMPLLSRIGRGASDTVQGQRFIMQVVPLRFISCEQISKLITPFISADGTIVTYDSTNVIIIVDKEINIQKALKLVEVLDVDIFSSTNHAIFRLEHVDAKEVVKIIQEMVSAYSAELQKETKIVSIDRLNALVVFSKKKQIFEKIQSFLKTLDVETYNAEPQIYIYSVKNGQAADLAALIGSVFSSESNEASQETKTETGGAPKPERTERTNNPFDMSAKQKKKRADGNVSGGAFGGGSLRGGVKIIPDQIRNALIIEAVPSDFAIIEKILNKIDVLPRQVLIEVMIAEITLDDKTEFGVEWSYDKGEGGSLSTSLLSATVGSAGLTAVIGQTDRWKSQLKTLATQNKVNILSSPSLLASDNKEATINVSTEIPVASTQYQTTTDVQPLLQTNIQYRNTGVILRVMPHINEFGLVSMDINQEVSEQSDPVKVGNSEAPSFFKRNVVTSLTVNNNQTIVIGGLIRETKSKGNSGVPILKDIPLLKTLFGKITDSVNKTELILLITPRVIVSLEDVNAVTDEFKYKLREDVGYSSR